MKDVHWTTDVVMKAKDILKELEDSIIRDADVPFMAKKIKKVEEVENDAV